VPRLMSEEMPCHLPNCFASALMDAAQHMARQTWGGGGHPSR
jgi:hypothetical protein